jgi:mannose-1-phosphate guanylyltransferase
MTNRYVLIMAGGVGSRFWPLSRLDRPKQFLDIVGTGRTLLQQTFDRFSKSCLPENIYVVTSEQHKSIVIEQLGIRADHVLAEPLRRNTAPCIAYGTYRIKAENPNAIIAVTPSDHLIKKEDEFCRVIAEAYDFAENHNALLTLGIMPDRPETGYGYIQADKKRAVAGYEKLLKVKTFTEKPDLELAKVFLESGDFYWNSGIFIWKADSIVTAFEKFLPDIFSVFDDGQEIYGTRQEKAFISRAYTSCRSISIDYGIMEKADNVYVICTDVGWSDLGTWSSLYEHSEIDNDGNAIIRGEVFSYNNSGSIINIAPGKVAVLQGLSDYIVVNTDDVLLVVKKEEEQNIKHFLEEVKKKTEEKFQ